MINIDNLIKQAMKSHNKEELLVYQAIKTEIINYKTAKNAKPYDEAAEISILKKMVKQREDSEKQYLEAGRKNLAIQEYNESEIIKKLLPEPVDKSQIYSELDVWCRENNFEYRTKSDSGLVEVVLPNYKFYIIPKKEMGNAIKYLKSKFPQADGKIISEIVKEYLV